MKSKKNILITLTIVLFSICLISGTVAVLQPKKIEFHSEALKEEYTSLREMTADLERFKADFTAFMEENKDKLTVDESNELLKEYNNKRVAVITAASKTDPAREEVWQDICDTIALCEEQIQRYPTKTYQNEIYSLRADYLVDWFNDSQNKMMDYKAVRNVVVDVTNEYIRESMVGQNIQSDQTVNAEKLYSDIEPRIAYYTAFYREVYRLGEKEKKYAALPR